ncbi:hypothetical protein EK599_18985 [Vibrio sp. T187]|uniref:hypothetical protein n=1 Tax=Vibrio TaxID=662 RepID=UPI0010C93E0F|nr:MULTISPECIES: hypothetical protein [Vibrio]MBW3697770.1 hypothetical protein [Vibrio sp. T187]
METQPIESVSFFTKHKVKFIVLFTLLLLVAGSFALSSAFVVHHTELPDSYWTTTSVLKPKLLDTPVFIGALTMMTVISIALLIWGYWVLHSLPKKHSAHTGQPKLVFWLCMLGFMYSWLWIAAIIIVVIDWDKLSQAIKRLTR